MDSKVIHEIYLSSEEEGCLQAFELPQLHIALRVSQKIFSKEGFESIFPQDLGDFLGGPMEAAALHAN